MSMNFKIHSTRTLDHVTQFLEKYVKGQGHKGT